MGYFMTLCEHLSVLLINYISGHARVDNSIIVMIALFFANSKLYLFCSVPVIGGNDVYVRLSVSGECKDKDSVWGTLENEVLLYCNNHNVLFFKQRIIMESDWPI